MKILREIVHSFKSFLCFPGMRGVLAGITIFEVIYWTSPQWTQKLPIATWEKTKAQDYTACVELVHASCKSEIVHDGGAPIPPEGLPEWTPQRVEKRFASGLTVVSTLGPHENFQYVVRALDLPEGTTFRVFQGKVIRI